MTIIYILNVLFMLCLFVAVIWTNRQNTRIIETLDKIMDFLKNE